jgi:hypothetical protein
MPLGVVLTLMNELLKQLEGSVFQSFYIFKFNIFKMFKFLVCIYEVVFQILFGSKELCCS